MKRKSYHIFLVLGVIVQLLLLTTLPSWATQQETSQWRLKAIPHGITYQRSDLPIETKILKVDSKGGEIEIKKWVKRVPSFYQTVRYSWTFSKDVSQIHQDDKIFVNVSVRIVDENETPNWNPTIRAFGGNGGASGGSKYLGKVSQKAKYLIWGDSKIVYARKGASHWKNDVPIGSGRCTLSVTDRSGIGSEMSAQDGYFRITLSTEYDVIYKYIADADGCEGKSDLPSGVGRAGSSEAENH